MGALNSDKDVLADLDRLPADAMIRTFSRPQSNIGWDLEEQ